MPRLRGSGSQRRQEEESDQLWSQREEAETRWRQRQQLQPPNDMLSSYSDRWINPKVSQLLPRYGWTQQAAPPRSPPRNWTSLDLAKPLWEEVMEYKPLWSKLIYCLLPLISNLAKDAAFNTLLFCTGGRQGRRHQSEGLQTRASPTVGFGRG